MTSYGEQEVEDLARGILGAAYRAASSNELGYLDLIPEICNDLEQWHCHNARGTSHKSVEYLAKACEVLAEELLRWRRGGAPLRPQPHLQRVLAEEVVDYLHEEGIYPLMSRSGWDAVSESDDDDIPECPF